MFPKKFRVPAALVPGPEEGATEAESQGCSQKGIIRPPASLGTYELRYGLRSWANGAGLRSIACCGLSPVPAAVPQIIREGVEEGRASVVGVRRCGSPFCATCGPRIAARRTADLLPQLRALEEQGRVAMLGCLTLQHFRDDELAVVFTILQRAWALTTSGRAWKALRVVGFSYVRGFDLTFSDRNGFHPHIHVTAMIGGPNPEGTMRAFLDLWKAKLASLGAHAVVEAGLFMERANSIADAVHYVIDPAKGKGKRETKARVGTGAVLEAAGAAVKFGNGLTDGQTMRDLAEAAVAGDCRRGRLWQVAAKAMSGAHMVTVSRDLRLTPTQEAAEGERLAEVVAEIEGTSGLRALDPHLGAVIAAAKVSVIAGRAALRAAVGPSGGGVWRLPSDYSVRDGPGAENRRRAAAQACTLAIDPETGEIDPGRAGRDAAEAAIREQYVRRRRAAWERMRARCDVAEQHSFMRAP